MHLAAQFGATHNIKILCDHEGDDQVVNMKNRFAQTPLWLACSNGHVESASVLLECSSDHTIANDQKLTPVRSYLMNQITYVEFH